MPTFSAAQVTDPFLSQNELLAPMAAYDTHANQLLQQQAATIANAYAPQKNQLLLDTGTIANQFATAKNPLEIQSLRQQLGLDPNPNRDQIMRLFSGDGTQPTSTAGGGSFLSALANVESGDKNIVSGTDKDSQGLTLAQGGNASEISQGHFQIQTATWKDFAKQAGVDVNQYPNAMSAPREVQAQVASVIPFNRFGPRTQTLMRQQFGDFDGSRTVGDLAGLGPRTQPPAPGVAPASAPLPPLNPNAGPRVANLPPVDPNATALPVPPIPPSVTPPAPNPNAAVQVPPAVTGDANMTAVKQAATGLLAMPEADAAVAYGPTVKALQAQGFAMNAPPEYPGHAALQALVSGNVPTGAAQPPAPYQVASNTPVAPPLPPNQMAPGGERGPPAPAPAQTGGLPRMADVPSGMARPEARQAQQLLQRATQIELLASQTPKDTATQQAAKAAADNLKLHAQQLLQTDSVVQTQEGQFHPMTGALDKPVANYHETSPGSGIWVGGPGADPRFQPPGRLVVGPDGTVYQTGVGGATVLEPSNPAAIAARKAAEAQGTETGKDVAKQLPRSSSKAATRPRRSATSTTA